MSNGEHVIEPGAKAQESNIQAYQMSGQEVEITATREGQTFPEMLVLSDEEGRALLVALARLYAGR
jgi:hypothetical protein